ncbi:exonuclease 1-like [Montipora capricornis]|uniref:exonuclease 1-like n=1 Tax=Montipora capricornis TaxID=246305 RepID=UPI0035F1ED4D
MSHKLLKVLRDKNIDCIVAPFEADAQLAYLNKNQLIDVVLSEDSDLLVFACCEVLYKVHLHGSCQSIQSKDIPKCLNISNYTFDLFRHMYIIAGCDYLESLPGIGIKRAHNLMKKVAAANGDVRKFFSRLPQVLGVKSLRVLGPEYLLRFDEADQMFLHQVVFDPRNLRAVPLNPILDESEAPPELQLLVNENDLLDTCLGNTDTDTMYSFIFHIGRCTGSRQYMGIQNIASRDRVNAEIVHFYANKIQKMHHRNFNASQDARH